MIWKKSFNWPKQKCSIILSYKFSLPEICFAYSFVFFAFPSTRLAAIAWLCSHLLSLFFKNLISVWNRVIMELMLAQELLKKQLIWGIHVKGLFLGPHYFNNKKYDMIVYVNKISLSILFIFISTYIFFHILTFTYLKELDILIGWI